MEKLIRAKEPFKFYTRLHLSELTGLKAGTIVQLLDYIKKVPDSCIYHHTHRFLQQHLFFSPEPPNDFAYWVTEMLSEDELGEELASIDTVRHSTIRSLREKIISVIELHLEKNQNSRLKFVRFSEEFHFIKSISFVMCTNRSACDLKEFVAILKDISVDSIYYHIFESRLRLEKSTNDFSNWIENSLGNRQLAMKIAKLDPYTHTIEALRIAIIKIINSDNLYE